MLLSGETRKPFSDEADTAWQFVFGSVSNFSSTVEVFHAGLIVVVVH